MTDQTLPTDILREIGEYWAGHRLHYTCTALYASWCSDNYVIVEHNVFTARDGCKDTVTTSRMPNGAFHGVSTAMQEYPADEQGYAEPPRVEVATYDRGAIALVTCDSDIHHTIGTIINGWCCVWCGDSDGPHDNDVGMLWRQDPLADINTRPTIVWNVHRRDFIETAHKVVRDSGVRGSSTTLWRSNLWHCPIPHAEC